MISKSSLSPFSPSAPVSSTASAARTSSATRSHPYRLSHHRHQCPPPPLLVPKRPQLLSVMLIFVVSSLSPSSSVSYLFSPSSQVSSKRLCSCRRHHQLLSDMSIFVISASWVKFGVHFRMFPEPQTGLAAVENHKTAIPLLVPVGSVAMIIPPVFTAAPFVIEE